ncbi:hypothetical protein D3C86_1916300 [compost metagenome]
MAGADQQQAGMRIGADIGGGLGEELVGDGDMRVVHHHHMRQVGDIGRAVGRSCGDDRGDHALEAVVEVA